MCGCRRLGVACGCCRLSATCGCVVLISIFVCRDCGAVFIYMRTIQTSKVYSISDKKSN